ncbi:MAG: hypothetical protein M0019_02130 [Actinomycetota bacterium]|nr:hypothetical protein [Actinomycetota bacterium]
MADQRFETSGTEERSTQRVRRLRSALPTVIFDVVGPLIIYYGLKSAGYSNVSALVVSGVLPGIRVVVGLVSKRRVDAIGILVLAGVIAGTVVGLISHSARLLLIEGVVPTAVFALACLFSLATSRPLMFRLALSFMGTDSERGRRFASMWQYERFRHVFRVITLVWGFAYVFEACVKVLIIETLSISNAKAITQILPYIVAGVVGMWNLWYGRRRRAEGLRAADRISRDSSES